MGVKRCLPLMVSITEVEFTEDCRPLEQLKRRSEERWRIFVPDGDFIKPTVINAWSECFIFFSPQRRTLLPLGKMTVG